MLIGPVLSGSLTQTVGYYYMNFTFGALNPLKPLALLLKHDYKLTINNSDNMCGSWHIVFSFSS